MGNNRKRFFIYILDATNLCRASHKYLVTRTYKTSADKLFSEECFLSLDVGENVEGILKIIRQVTEKLKSVELSISISTEDYIKYWMKVKEYISSSIPGPHFGRWKSEVL